MNDLQLTELLKMAKEADDFGRAGASSLELTAAGAKCGQAGRALPARVAKADPYRILGWSTAGLAAAAACAAAVILLRVDGGVHGGGTPVGGAGDVRVAAIPERATDVVDVVGNAVTDAATAGADRKVVTVATARTPVVPELRDSIIVAMYKGSDGGTRCVRIKSHEWDCGRGIEDLSEGELIGFAFESACDSVLEEGPERLVVLAMSGPKGAWSKEADTAEAIAAALEWSPETCGIEASCYADVARQCLPPGVMVRAETMAVR